MKKNKRKIFMGYILPVIIGMLIGTVVQKCVLKPKDHNSYTALTELELFDMGCCEGGDEFRTKITISAINLYRDTHILPSIIISQAILESGHGKFAIKNNIFGIKANKDWKGETVRHTTHEHLPLHYTKKPNYRLIKKISNNIGIFETTGTFKAYNTIHEAIKDYCDLLTSNPRYSKIVGVTDHDVAIKILKEAGYATDIHYIKKINDISKRYSGQLANDIAITADKLNIRFVMRSPQLKI